MTQSLRGRLLIGVISLVVLGLLISSAVTYLTMQHFLVQRLDDQLSNGRAAARGVLGGPGPSRGASDQFPIGTVVELLAPDGSRVQEPLRYDFPSSTSNALPVIPKPLPASTEKSPAMVTLAGTGGVSHYRAAIWPEDSFHGNYVVLTIPMDDVLSTLNQLLQLEGLISAGVVVATAILALLIIRIGLRPLEKMGGVAQDIAAGDLSRRVEPATPKTEIGRLGQGRPLEMEPIDLQAIATDAVADARVVAPQRDINLASSGAVVVNGDDTRLRQVLGNLVRNALVHTPPQTPIDISLSTEDSIAKLSVMDHGPGLPAEDIDRIFEPFYRADPSRSRDSGGAGLGLSIVIAVVTAHGGHVTVRETQGGGATLEVDLPLAGT